MWEGAQRIERVGGGFGGGGQPGMGAVCTAQYCCCKFVLSSTPANLYCPAPVTVLPHFVLYRTLYCTARWLVLRWLVLRWLVLLGGLYCAGLY
eukprot:2745387-Rhodomonas_salina.1